MLEKYFPSTPKKKYETVHFSTSEKQYCAIESTLAYGSDRNSFETNQNYSDSLRYLYPTHCESFQTNPKNVL